ncbi:mechanosensitive ion channel family protein [Amorphus coralli]|uniref:mechanosensitive ion channel family protein n=1 Tax=Amorphus coralli TaxID=340680 RepID=UPI000A03F611|nr:mechanosensitive ion channel domain-containing protein [Amorphus coralli]
MKRSGTGHRAVALFACIAMLLSVVAVALSSPAAAQAALVAREKAASDSQAPSGGSEDLSAGLQAVIEQAETAGAQVIVIAPRGTEVEEEEPDTPMEAAGELRDKLLKTTAEVEDKLDSLSTRLPFLPEHVVDTLRNASHDGSLSWLGRAALLGAITLAAGALAYLAIVVWSRRHLFRYFPPVPQSRAQKIGFLLTRAVVLLLVAAVFSAVGHVIAVLVTEGGSPIRATNLLVVTAGGVGLAFRAVARTLLCPDLPAYRPFAFSDASARSMFSRFMLCTWAALFVLTIASWMKTMGMVEDAYQIVFVLAGFVGALTLSLYALAYRREIRDAILAHEPGRRTSFGRRLLAQSWHILVVAYLALAFVVSAVGRLVGDGTDSGLIIGPVIALILSLGVYAVLVLLIERWFPLPRPAEPEPVPQPLGAAVAEVDDLDDDAFEEEVPLERREVGRVAFKSLFEHGAAIVACAFGVVLILHMWGIPVTAEGHIVARFFGIVMVLFVSYMAYEAVKLWIDGKIAAEQATSPGDGHGGHGDAEMGTGASRVATLLPLFRNFLLITIATMAIMIGLAGIGVNIAPLFAGAGVVGLAIGFGAQTLIRDIFSGAFFLIDDAFRRGEYIDLGGVKGVVEKISIRSFQLRHQNGPLHTIPFGEIKRLTNYSRDWVIMKLPLRLTYDTDPEKVRKLVKKLGTQLLEDPDIGHMFLDQLKSQGVYQMEDSAMIIRVKFMTRPGDQFLVRKRVYAEIRELFEREDIHFAHREVTVRFVDDEEVEGAENEEERRKLAAGAAARRLLDEEAEAGKRGGEDPSAAR